MSISAIHGQLLEFTVVSCNKLKDTEWISRQDPYVCIEYASTKFRTRTCTDGGKNPTFQEKFTFNLIEGLREVSVSVWNSNTLSTDDFIGSGKIQLQKVLSEGYDDCSWTLQGTRSRYAGEVRLIMHYASVNKPSKAHAPSAPPYPVTPAHQAPLYSAPPQSAAFPPTSYPSYPPPPSSGYYPPQPYPQANCPQTYPSPSPYPPHSAYPPPPQNPQYYPPGSYPPQSHYPPPSY